MKFTATCLLVGASLLLPPFCGPGHAEWRGYPALTVNEAYTDNLYNDERDKESALITRMIPSFALEYDAARLTLDFSYALDYRIYSGTDRGSEAVHFIDGVSLLNYADLVFLEVVEQLARESLDSARDYRDESLFENQSDRNIFSISPYLEFRPSARSRFKGGYRYARTKYEEDTGVDKDDSIFFLESSYELTDRTTLRSGYSYIEEDSSQEDHQKHDLWAGMRWQTGANTSLFATLGYTWIEFTDGVEQDDLFWDFGASHDFGLLVAIAAVGVAYLEDPEGTILRQENYRLTVSRNWLRSRLATSVYMADYYDVEADDLDTRRYGVSGSFNHEFTPRWNGTVGGSADKYEDPVEDTWTRRLIGRLAVSYLIAEDFTATLSYYRIDSHSPEEPDDRYETNNVMLEARKVF